MKEEDLSPEAKYHLRERELETTHGDWLSNYMAMLKEFAERNTSDVTEWEIKGQGIEVLEKCREEHRIAGELQYYATHQLETFRLLELDGSPESPPVSLDEFLKRAMPNTGREVLRERFMRFLIEKAESEVDQQMALHPRPGISRDECVKQLATGYFTLYEEDGVHGPTRNYRGPEFRDWWKRHEGNPLGEHNNSKKIGVNERQLALIGLLPSRRNQSGIDKPAWKKLAEKKDLFTSRETFDRDLRALITAKKIQVQENGNFRQLPK